jgi:hypothetical protein
MSSQVRSVEQVLAWSQMFAATHDWQSAAPSGSANELFTPHETPHGSPQLPATQTSIAGTLEGNGTGLAASHRARQP